MIRLVSSIVGADQPVFYVGVKTLRHEEDMMKIITNSKGFTLVEAMFALVILMIAVAGLIMPFASSAAVLEQGRNQTIAAKLACDRVEQILSDSNYWSPGNYNELKGQIKNANGDVFTDPMYSSFSREAACEDIYVAQQQPQNFGTYHFMKITVKVYEDDLKLAEVVRLKSK